MAGIGAILATMFEQQGFEVGRLVNTLSIIVGEAVSVYCAYLYVRDKGRHPTWALVAVFSLWGWIVLWILPDEKK